MASQRHDFEKIIEKLNAEPLTHLMLGHRELFHSNLLAWFFECLQDESDAVFGELTKASSNTGERRKVQREKNHLDLWFHWPNRHSLVIENKVFSLPDVEQLETYTTEKHAENTSFWLLSLSDPDWTDNKREINRHNWHWLSFQKLAELIRSAFSSDNSSYDVDPMRRYSVETMRHYARVTDLLHELAARVEVRDSNETVRLPDDAKAALNGSRLMSSMAKLRASSIKQRVSKALYADGITCGGVEANMTRSEPINEWFWPINADWKAGWQVQHDQFRLAIHLEKENDKLRGANAKKDREAYAHSNEEFFDFSDLDDALDTKSEPLNNFYCHYNPDFVYRYKKVRNLTVDQLEKAAVIIARRPYYSTTRR